MTLFYYRLGQCIPYEITPITGSSGTGANPCDKFFNPGIDTIYVPNGRDLRVTSDVIGQIYLSLDAVQLSCG